MVAFERTFRVAGIGLVVALVAAGCGKENPPPPSDSLNPISSTPGTGGAYPPLKASPSPLEGGSLNKDTEQLKRVYFEYDSTTLSSEARATLQEDYDWLRAYPSARIEIEGHCDERGTNEYNLALGQKRAQAVKSYLTQLGVNASRIETISYGEELPANPGHDEAAYRLNRRAQFRLLSQ